MQKLLYSYEGEMNNAILNSILYAMEHKLAELGKRPPFIKKINSILIECCQNLIHHPDKPQSDSRRLHFPSVSVTQTEDGLFIQTRNLIHKDNVEPLRSYIDKINAMEKQELKEYFQEVLTNGKIGPHGGGGLGLLNIIRKAKDLTLHYKFDPLNDDEMFFTLSFTI